MEHSQDSSHNVKPKASQKAPLWSAKPYSSSGRTQSQGEAPFSWERYMACAREGERISLGSKRHLNAVLISLALAES